MTGPDGVRDAGVGQTWAPLLILALVMAVGFTAMGSFGAVQEGAKAELHLTDPVLGMIQGMSAAISLVAFSVPIGLLVDRTHRVRLIAATAVLWTLGTALTAFAGSVTMLFVARMLTGIGTTGALTAALSLCADFCAPAQRGRAMLIVNLGKSLGVAAAFGLSGWLYGRFVIGHVPAWLVLAQPWRSTHLALALLGTACLAPLALLREPARRETEAGPSAPLAVLARELLARRAFLAPLFAGQVAVVMADVAAGVWVAPVLTRNFHQQPQQFGGWVGAVVFGAGIAGAVVGGISADRGQRSGRRGGLLSGAVWAAAIGVPAALFPVLPTTFGLGLALFVLVACGAVTGLVISVALTVHLPNELRGLCIGAFIASAGVLGYGLAPPLVGWVSLALGGEQNLAPALAVVGVVVSALSFIAFRSAMHNAPDRATSEPVRQVLREAIG